MLMKKHRVPIHMTQSTADAYCAENAGVDAERIVCHPSVFSERVGGVTVSSFPTSHDSVQSVGYRISAGNLAVAVATDMGYVSDSVRQNLLGAKYVVLESNHDENMLLLGPYPYHLKRRILSRRGHLSNDDAAALAVELLQNGTERILLAHLSENNNTPLLARQTVLSALQLAGIDDASERIRVAKPDTFTALADDLQEVITRDSCSSA
mgnify:CR=1 FL=1